METENGKILVLKGIKKDYLSGANTVHALKGVDIEFGKREFVSVLGPSGCGKTTLLNIIGGLDRYTEGDLFVRGRSTKDFGDRDWDSYRNHSVGFVFQTYNLIPHQTVLENVELALTLSGINRAERRQKAKAALEKVGLGDQLGKKPNQLSGGQMQRVAIARAIVNDPDIILADEPTGALDSETSVSVLEILKEISRTRLVIMVTHNAELAEKYSTRIINLLDGELVSDEFKVAPETEKKETPAERSASKRPSMSYLTALALSFRNLLTKKGRTVLTSFAGSIGIIGIALILAFSNGIQIYIDRVQEDALSMYPLAVQENALDLSGLADVMSSTGSGTEHDRDAVYSDTTGAKLVNSLLSQIKRNDLASFKQYLQTENDVTRYATSIQYSYGVDLNIYTLNNGKYLKVNPSDVLQQIYGEEMGNSMNTMLSTYSSDVSLWKEMINNYELLNNQYDILEGGRWPEAANELVLFINKNNEINDLVLYALGVKDSSEISGIIKAAMSGEKINTEQVRLTYEEIYGMSFLLLPTTSYYSVGNTVEGYDIWTNNSDDPAYVESLLKSGEAIELKIVGIARPKENTIAGSNGGIGYTVALPQLIIDRINDSKIVKQQLADPTRSVLTGMKFDTGEIDMDKIRAYIELMPEEQRAMFQAYLATMTEEQLMDLLSEMIKSGTTYEDVCKAIGIVDLDKPTVINIYASTFEDKEKITNAIAAYNAEHEEDGKSIKYTDYVAMFMSSVSTIVKFISYALIAFVSISLVVSSIMIGIITYISVLERTKEIGILRSIGASKRDISRVFRAETLIVGFVAGMFGILVTLILIIPFNVVIRSLSDIAHIAQLPVSGAVVLVLISMLLTLIAGLIPARMASRKDPVIALRVE